MPWSLVFIHVLQRYQQRHVTFSQAGALCLFSYHLGGTLVTGGTKEMFILAFIMYYRYVMYVYARACVHWRGRKQRRRWSLKLEYQSAFRVWLRYRAVLVLCSLGVLSWVT